MVTSYNKLYLKLLANCSTNPRSEKSYRKHNGSKYICLNSKELGWGKKSFSKARNDSAADQPWYVIFDFRILCSIPTKCRFTETSAINFFSRLLMNNSPARVVKITQETREIVIVSVRCKCAVQKCILNVYKFPPLIIKINLIYSTKKKRAHWSVTTARWSKLFVSTREWDKQMLPRNKQKWTYERKSERNNAMIEKQTRRTHFSSTVAKSKAVHLESKSKKK